MFTGGTAENPTTAPATGPVRIWHLFTHTAGLTHGFHHVHATDELYRNAGFGLRPARGYDLAACTDAWATLPLVNEPGARFNYSHATDVLGRLVEVIAGVPFDEFLTERCCARSGCDTAFWADGDKAERLGALYVPHGKHREILRYDPIGKAALRPRRTRPAAAAGVHRPRLPALLRDAPPRRRARRRPPARAPAPSTS